MSRASALDKSAWVHHCGEINAGTWIARTVCGRCRFTVDHAEDVEQYRLVRVWRIGTLVMRDLLVSDQR